MKTLKKVTDLNEQECIHCTTKAEAEKICQLMHDAGLMWCTGVSYNDYNRYKKDICYFPKNGTWDCYSGAKTENIVHPAKDFIKQKITKSELLRRIENLEKNKEPNKLPEMVKGSPEMEKPETRSLFHTLATEDEKEKIQLYTDMLRHAKEINQIWEPEFNNRDNAKYSMAKEYDNIFIVINNNRSVFGIGYKTRDMAEQAKEKFKERILKYYGN